MKLGYVLASGVAIAVATSSYAQDKKKDKKVEYHCEVTKDGEHKDVEATDKADCKKKGGKWQKGKGGDHDHG
jgi:hypothetical protein